MTVFSYLLSSDTGILAIIILTFVFIGSFIYNCKHKGVWKAILKTVVSLLLVLVAYTVLYYWVSKTDLPFVLLPLF